MKSICPLTTQTPAAFAKRPVPPVIVLQSYRDFTLPQIAELLQVPIGTVRSRSHYAKRVLRAAIEADSRPTIVETSVR